MTTTTKTSKTKSKKKKKLPRSFLDCESLVCVAGILPTAESSSSFQPLATATAPRSVNTVCPPHDNSSMTLATSLPKISILSTPVASNVVKEIFLNRFEREIIQPFFMRQQQQHQDYLCKEEGSTLPGKRRYRNISYSLVDGKLLSNKKNKANAATGKKEPPVSKSFNNVQNEDDELLDTTSSSAKDDKSKPRGPLVSASRSPNISNKISSSSSSNTSLPRQMRALCKRRMVMGTNQCLRVLERTKMEQETNNQDKQVSNVAAATTTPSTNTTLQHRGMTPSLMILARDIYPPTMLTQAPLWASALRIPLLMLPGQASSELGAALGTKKTSIILFLPSAMSTSAATGKGRASEDCDGEEESLDKNGDNGDILSKHDEDDHHAAINSFVRFVVSQIPQAEDDTS
jgi:ribosomal protein L7Ae-like RNA K-turn-binding protein